MDALSISTNGRYATPRSTAVGLPSDGEGARADDRDRESDSEMRRNMYSAAREDSVGATTKMDVDS